MINLKKEEKKMNNRRIGISADCVCDLPQSYISENDIGLAGFYITTENGKFLDGKEISSQNVIDYYRKGNKAITTSPPSVEEFKKFFRDMLKEYDQLIHITVSSGASDSYKFAAEALDKDDELRGRVILVDSLSLSTGMAHLIMRAAEMSKSGYSMLEIVAELDKIREHINAVFIAESSTEMYRNGRISKTANRFCKIFGFHPIFKVKGGNVVFGGVEYGGIKGAAKRFIKKTLKKKNIIDTRRLFITHVGCRKSEIEYIKAEVAKRIEFDEVIVTNASATISGNSGAETFGLLYLNKC